MKFGPWTSCCAAGGAYSSGDSYAIARDVPSSKIAITERLITIVFFTLSLHDFYPIFELT
jgi:hypothetical protein